MLFCPFSKYLLFSPSILFSLFVYVVVCCVPVYRCVCIVMVFAFIRSYVRVSCVRLASGIVPFMLCSNDRVDAMSDLENNNE